MPKLKHYRDLTTAQVADRLDVSRDTVNRWIRNGTIPAQNIAAEGERKRYRIRAADLDALIAEQDPEAVPA